MEMIVLRLIHIFGGVFWAGSLIYLALFIMPAVTASGPDGSRFMQQLSKTNKLPLWLTIAGTLVVLAGIRLIMIDSGNFKNTAWFSSPMGMTFTIGGTLTLIAYFVGVIVNRPTIMKMAKIGGAIAASGAAPTPEQAAELGILRKRFMSATNAVAGLLILAVICMSVARYMSMLMQ